MRYKRCPRCEINYILVEEDFCEVCLRELKGNFYDDDDYKCENDYLDFEDCEGNGYYNFFDK